MTKSIAPSELTTLMGTDQHIILLDVRRKDDFDKDPTMLSGAQWKNPAELDQWLPDLPTDKEIVVYCVRGGTVSQSVQQQLSASGRKARFVEGGWEALRKEQ